MGTDLEDVAFVLDPIAWQLKQVFRINFKDGQKNGKKY